jgi:hypothetical protein
MKLTLSKLLVLVNFLVVITLMCSCNVYFNSPQPSWVTKNEKEIPRKLRGNYISGGGELGHDPFSSKRTHDTVRITEKRIIVRNQDLDLTLSDSVLLRIYHRTYFLNWYTKRDKAWNVLYARLEKKKILYYMISTENWEDSIKFKRLMAITKVEETSDSKNKDYHFNIDPSSKEFRKILKADLFAVMDTLKKIKP